MKKLYDYEIVKEGFKKNDLTLLSLKEEYKNCNTRLLCVDNNGYLGYMTYYSLTIGQTFKPFSIRNSFGLKNLNLYFKNNGGKCIPLFDKMPTSKEKSKFKCECGNIFYANLDSMLNSNKNSCVACAIKNNTDKNRTDFNELKKFLSDKGYKLLQNFYINNKSPLEVEDECGYRGFVIYNKLKSRNILMNKFNLRINEKYFIYNLNLYCKINNIDTRAIKICKKLDMNSTLIQFKCGCGNIFYTTKGKFIGAVEKQRCDVCTKRMSSYELKIKNWLDKYKINYICQKKYVDCKNKNSLPFDFYLKKYGILIEADGEGHFFPACYNGISKQNAIKRFKMTKNNDSIKNKYCIKNNITLIRIPYYEFKNGNYIKILKDKLLK